MDCSTPGFPVHHQFLELVQTHLHRVSDAIQLSHPLSSPSPLPSIFPASGSFPVSQFFTSGGQSIGERANNMLAREVTRGLSISYLVEWEFPEGKEGKRITLVPIMCRSYRSLTEGPPTTLRDSSVRNYSHETQRDWATCRVRARTWWGRELIAGCLKSSFFPKPIPCCLRFSHTKPVQCLQQPSLPRVGLTLETPFPARLVAHG